MVLKRVNIILVRILVLEFPQFIFYLIKKKKVLFFLSWLTQLTCTKVWNRESFFWRDLIISRAKGWLLQKVAAACFNLSSPGPLNCAKNAKNTTKNGRLSLSKARQSERQPRSFQYSTKCFQVTRNGDPHISVNYQCFSIKKVRCWHNQTFSDHILMFSCSQPPTTNYLSSLDLF